MDAPPPPPDVPEAPRSPTAADGPPPIPKQGMVRNIAWLSGGSILVKPLWILFIVAACPRLLGVEAYGTMQSALALAAMILMVSDMGTSNLTLREVAAQPGEAVRYLSNILVLRGVLAAVCILGALLANPGKLLTHRWMLAEVWDGSHGDETRAALRAHLLTDLRTRLVPQTGRAGRGERLHLQRGVGVVEADGDDPLGLLLLLEAVLGERVDDDPGGAHAAEEEAVGLWLELVHAAVAVLELVLLAEPGRPELGERAPYVRGQLDLPVPRRRALPQRFWPFMGRGKSSI